jgi:hypothetical protein
VPGWPLPAFWTASMVKIRAVAMARASRSVETSADDELGLPLTGWAPSLRA